ncbi:hypothetical protein evm_011043 [Chilo suppressalis]|nr:hypothetical protein evm_011043 [Chilo suppressalis]
MPYKSHKCSLNLGSNSMLPKDYTSAICRGFRKHTLVSEYHPETYQYLRSYAAVLAERQRHIAAGGVWLIHPFSLFSLSWNTFMVVVNLAHMVVSTLRLAYVLDPFPLVPGPNTFDYILLSLHILCVIDIALMFNMGYVEEHENVILNRKAVISRYLCSWFLVDLVSCLPVAFVLLYLRVPNTRYLLVAHLLAVLRIARVVCTMENLKIFLQIFGGSYIHYSSIHVVVMFLLSLHWCSCILYACPVLGFYWYGEMPHGYAVFLTWHDPNNQNISEHTISTRYEMGTFITLASFFGCGYAMFLRKKPEEIVVHTVVLVYTALFMLYLLVFLIKLCLSQFRSLTKYHELINQIKEYIRHRQFPVELQKRVLAFYYYTFQGTYFREEVVFGSLSEQLRNEMVLHTCHKLVHKVALFEGLPASVVGSILGCLTHEVYLPNDPVLRAGDVGDCMYFIDTGTVAVYSLKGVEVCHLHDGAHFGVVALLMKDSKRAATVVAVEITQVYRLDVADFRHFTVTSQVFYDRMAAIASQRMHEVVLVDEAFQRERDYS